MCSGLPSLPLLPTKTSPQKQHTPPPTALPTDSRTWIIIQLEGETQGRQLVPRERIRDRLYARGRQGRRGWTRREQGTLVRHTSSSKEVRHTRSPQQDFLLSNRPPAPPGPATLQNPASQPSSKLAVTVCSTCWPTRRGQKYVSLPERLLLGSFSPGASPSQRRAPFCLSLHFLPFVFFLETER